MKPSARDYLAITAALLAILLCGYGIGFLVGERTTRMRLAPVDATTLQAPDWTAATVERLTRELELTPAQQTAVEKEVRVTAGRIATTRRQAVREYRQALIDLHQRLAPLLDPAQRKLVEESQRQLQSSLDKDGGPPDGSSK